MERAPVATPSALAILLLAVSAAGPAAPDAFTPPDRDVLWPVPRQVRWGRGLVDLTATTPIVVGEAATPEDLYAARELNDELRSRYGWTLPVLRASQLYTYLTAANYFWNPFAPDPQAVQETALARRFSDAWTPPRVLGPIAGAPADLSAGGGQLRPAGAGSCRAAC